MSQTVGSPPLSAPVVRDERMRHITWGALLLAFAVWLGLVSAGMLWGGSIVQRASAPAPTTVSQVAGVVLYREVGQRTETSAQSGMLLFDGDEVATSEGATAMLQVFDGSVFHLSPEARLRVQGTRIGRFNPSATRAAFRLQSGAVRLTVPQIPDKPHTLNVQTPHGGAAFVPGEYTLRTSAGATRIGVWEGRAAGAGAGQVREAIGGEKLLLTADGAPQVIGLLENWVRNGDFSERFQGWEPWEVREQGRPDAPGQLQITEGRGLGAPSVALRLTRESQVDAHNETGLRQRLAVDVRAARAVRLEALIRLDFASLSGGGYLGSEYPMMLRVRARDRRDAEQIWTRGFYFANPESRPAQIGRQVEPGEWVKVSADLVEALRQPVLIESIEVFAAGHTYEASIGEVKLLVD
jgi:hypothetical protein